MDVEKKRFFYHLCSALLEVPDAALRRNETFCTYCHLNGKVLGACTGDNCFILTLKEVALSNAK